MQGYRHIGMELKKKTPASEPPGLGLYYYLVQECLFSTVLVFLLCLLQRSPNPSC